MSGIIDYSLMNAHKDFNALPFSKVDGLIFAQLAYLDFDTFVPEKQLFARGITFAKIAEQEGFENLFPLERTARKKCRSTPFHRGRQASRGAPEQ